MARRSAPRGHTPSGAIPTLPASSANARPSAGAAASARRCRSTTNIQAGGPARPEQQPGVAGADDPTISVPPWPRSARAGARRPGRGSDRHGGEQVDLGRVVDALEDGAFSFFSARCSICRTRSLLMPRRTPSSSSVRPSSSRRRSRMMVRSRSLSSASDRASQRERCLLSCLAGHTPRGRAARRRGSPARRPRRSGDGGVERLVAAHHPHLHRLDLAHPDRSSSAT